MKVWVGRQAVLAAALLVLTAVAGCVRPTQDGEPRDELACTVVRVVDGDTVNCADGTRVRLLAIDTPEMAQEPFGELAKEQLEELIPTDRVVRLELDEEPVDRYGRTLAYLRRADGSSINEELAESGYAVDLIYRPNTRYAERIREAVERARQANRGLWAIGGFRCIPRDFRAKRCGT